MRINSSRSMSFFFAVVWAFLLAACGGGGSGNSSSTPTNPTTPVVNTPTLTLVGSAPAVSAATQSTLTATLKTSAGAALPGVVVTFKTAGSTFGSFVPTSGTALTDGNGNATVSLAAGTQTGADSVTASATVNGVAVTSNVLGYTSTGTTTGPTVALVSLSASQTSVASDNSTSTTITAIVVDSSNAALAGVVVTFSADTGLLNLASAVSDASGKAVVTFSSGTTNPATRTATITATASGKTTQIPIVIAGAAVTVSSTASSLIAGGSPATLTVVAKSGASAPLPNQAVTIAVSGTGAVTLGATSGTTDASGTFTTTVTPTVAGDVTLTITAVGLTRTIAYTISGATAAFQIVSPAANPATGTIATPLPVTVAAPAPTTSVTFVTTLGTWENGSTSVTKPVVAGSATANLTAPSSGVANVIVYSASAQSTNSSRLISFTAPPTAAYRITLQSSPSVVAQTRGSTTGISTLLASVFDVSGNPVGNVTVAFSILNPTGGGESIAPVVSTTASIATSTIALGQASATFTSGSLPSSAQGVRIRATVVSTAIATNNGPSGTDAAVVIGGTAGSVTIGRASVGTSDASNTLYTLPMSVLVADANGNPVANAAVSLSAWPIAFNTSTTACSADPNLDFLNEDDVSGGTSFENLSLDPGEDGARVRYPSGLPVPNGTLDRQLTPPNSASGTLPATVTTDANGTATFNLTYTKANALFITDRITARTFVQGTETKGQVIFRLPALVSDIGPPCLLPASPYAF